MEQVQGSFNQIVTLISGYVPKAVGAIVLLVAAWLIGSLIRAAVRRLGSAVRLDQRTGFAITHPVGDLTYWLTFLFFLPGILEALGLQQLLLPVQVMLNKLTAFMPNLLAAAIICGIGWFVAQLVRRTLQGVLAAAGVDRLAARWHLTSVLGDRQVSGILGTLVFAVVIVGVAQAALTALQLDVLTRPVEAVVTKAFSALPNIIAAALLMGVVVWLGRVAGQFFGNLLSGIGLDALVGRLGMARFGETEGATKVSALLAWLVTAAIILLGAMEAANLLGFGALNTLIAQFSVFAGQLLLGTVIFGNGLYVAKLAGQAVEGSGTAQAGLLATLARGAVLVFAGAMALRQMGLAPEIVTVAFSLLLGALAVAFALAFGLGSRDSAGKLVADLIERFKR